MEIKALQDLNTLRGHIENGRVFQAKLTLGGGGFIITEGDFEGYALPKILCEVIGEEEKIYTQKQYDNVEAFYLERMNKLREANNRLELNLEREKENKRLTEKSEQLQQS